MVGTLTMLRLLTRPATRMYECPLCGAGFSERTELDYHARREHQGAGRSYRCADCDQVFASRKRLMDHLARAHRRE